MRAILLILIIAVVALIAAVATGLIDIRQTSPAVAPGVESSDGKLTTTPGQAPSFDIETGSVGVTGNAATVRVPSIEIKREGTAVSVPGVEVKPPVDDANANQAR